MTSHQEILQQLQILLTNELTAVDQYVLHGAYQKDWGFTKLAEHSAKEAAEERGHAAALLDRILFFGGIPDISQRHSLQAGKDIPLMLQAELAMEEQAIKDLCSTIELCAKIHDYGTQSMAVAMLKEEEGHSDWIRTQQGLIKHIGLPNYLQTLI